MGSPVSKFILGVQALIAELPVEALDEGTLEGLCGLNDMPLDPRV